MKTILMKLSGPLQSWGTGSHFETRHTDLHPSKSAIIGMIAASMGLRRDEDEQIKKLNQLDFAVRVDQPGKLLRDYHTARKYKRNGTFDRTYVTNRYYLEDAVFIVGIAHEDEEWLDLIEQALKNPYFQPFMGRRSLPLPSDFFIGSMKKTVIDSLKSTSWQANYWYKKEAMKNEKKKIRLSIYADVDLVDTNDTTMRQDRVESFSQKERKHNFRAEGQIKIDIVKEKNEHDAFNGIGG